MADWTNLLAASGTTEPDCLAFLRDHAGLFFVEHPETPFAIAELELGSDLRVDFAVVREGYSSGTQYTLYELEPPNAKLFTRDGHTSHQLTKGLDQVRDWRRWLRANRRSAEQLLPSKTWANDGHADLRFAIVIGRREETEQWSERISGFREDETIDLVSFDRLTERLLTHSFPLLFRCGLAAETKSFQKEVALRNRAVNPFHMALSSAQWRALTKRHPYWSGHITESYLTAVVDAIGVNHDRKAAFDKRVAATPRAEIESVLRAFGAVD
jgi:hypothetical protein